MLLNLNTRRWKVCAVTTLYTRSCRSCAGGGDDRAVVSVLGGGLLMFGGGGSKCELGGAPEIKTQMLSNQPQ